MRYLFWADYTIDISAYEFPIGTPMGEAVDQSFSQMTPGDIRALVAYVRSVPAVTSDLPATLAPPAPISPKEGATANAVGKKVFEQACVSCHNFAIASAC